MNKSDMVSVVAASAGVSKTTAESTINCFLDAVKWALTDGETIQLNNFGAFELQRRNERIGRNPHTKEAVHIPARYAVKFTPSLELKKAVEGYTPKTRK